MTNLVRAEFLRARSRLVLWGCALVGGVWVVGVSLGSMNGMGVGVVGDVLELVAVVIPLLCFVYAASVVGAEWTANAVSGFLTLHPKRGRLLGARLLGVGVSSMMLVAALLMLAVVMSIGRMLLTGSVSLGWDEMRSLPLIGVRVVLVGLCFSVLGACTANITRGTAGAMIAAMLYIVVEPIGLARVELLRPWLLSPLIFDVSVLGEAVGMLRLVVYAIVGYVIAMVRFLGQEF